MPLLPLIASSTQVLIFVGFEAYTVLEVLYYKYKSESKVTFLRVYFNKL